MNKFLFLLPILLCSCINDAPEEKNYPVTNAHPTVCGADTAKYPDIKP